MSGLHLTRRDLGIWLLQGMALVYFVIGKHGYEPRLSLGVVSLNQILQLVVLAATGVVLLRGARDGSLQRRSLVLALCVALLLAIGAWHSINFTYASAKALGFAFVVVPCLVLATQLRPEGLRRVLLLWAIVGTSMMLLGVVSVVAGRGPTRLAVLGGGANVYARMVASALLVGIGLGALSGVRGARFWRLGLGCGFACALLFAGSKAVILAFAAGLIAFCLVGGRRRHAAGILAVLVLFGLAPLLTHRWVERAPKDRGEIRMFRQPDTDDPQGSYGTRMRYYAESMVLLRQRGLWGVGTGDWGPALGISTGRLYPHNWIVELACELGLPGGAAGVAALVLAWALVHRARAAADPRLAATLVGWAVFWGVNASLSGDLVDNRHLWTAFLGLEIGVMPLVGRATAAASLPDDAGAAAAWTGGAA